MKLFTTVLFFFLSTTLVLGQLETKIDSLFAEYNNSPGCAIGVYSNGEILYKKGYGIANLDYNIKISPETVFDIGSVSKQFTAACIVILENEGKLSLEDDIRKYIPEIPEFEEGKITIRNLLHHTSGLRDYITLMYLSGISFDDYFTEQMGLDILARQKELNFIPGSEYLYSNSGYLALAIIVRRVSGESIGTFAQKKIFDPLEMKNTFIYEDGAKVIKNRAIGYSKEGNDYKRVHHFDFAVGGDGQVYTTVEDFFKWSENFKSSKLGNSSFLNKMLTKGILSNGDTIDYALGLTHGVYKNRNTISHGGAWGAFRAYYLQFPEDDLAVAVMSNFGSMNTGKKARQIADLILQDALVDETQTKDVEANTQEPAKALEKFTLKQLTGNYEIRAGVVVEITVKNDSLHVLQTWNKSSYKIINTTGNTYQRPNEPSVQFVFSDLKGDLTQTLTVLQNGNETICKRKEEIELPNLNPAEYIGDYYSEELDVSYSILLEDEMLKVKVAYNDAQELKQYELDAFTADYGLFRFYRSNGKIQGLFLESGSMTNLEFEKK